MAKTKVEEKKEGNNYYNGNIQNGLFNNNKCKRKYEQKIFMQKSTFYNNKNYAAFSFKPSSASSFLVTPIIS